MAYVITDECLACGACLAECPADAIQEGDIYSISADACAECGLCVDSCPVGAIIEE
jgi:ferredoxin